MDKMPRTILITGTTGLVGHYLYKIFKASNGENILGTSRSPGSFVDNRVDLTNRYEVAELAQTVPADVIVHTAAISKTDVCQENKERCYKANVESTKNLISAFPHSKFIYFSTYAVYNTPEGKCTGVCTGQFDQLLYRNQIAGGKTYFINGIPTYSPAFGNLRLHGVRT